jgi:hypothetical protein
MWSVQVPAMRRAGGIEVAADKLGGGCRFSSQW